jgi:signal transduction histidine kinase
MGDFILDKFYLYFQGFLILQAIFFGAIYTLTRKKEVGYYALYLLLTAIYFFYNAVHTFFGLDDALVFKAAWYWWINVPVIIVFEICYIYFLKSLIEGIVHSHRLNVLFRWTLYGFLLLIPLHLICIGLSIDNSIIFLLSHIWLTVYGLAVVKSLFQQKTLFAQLVSVGIIVNILGGTTTIIATLLGQHGVENLLTVSYPIFFLRAGMLVDIFLFQIALLTKWHLQEQQLLKTELESKFILSKVKSKISADLHDDIGSVLSSISLQTEVIKRKLQRHENVDELVQHINESSKEMISRMSDIVWSLRVSHDTMSQLIERVDNYCATHLPDQGITYTLTNLLPEPTFTLQPDTMRELYLIIKEALNNSLKHAACSHIELAFRKEEQTLKIVISDNGRGFDTQKPHRSLGGDGLKNMQLRCEHLKGQLSISSTPGQGTFMEVLIPIQE